MENKSVSYNSIIRSVSYNQKEILSNIIKLYNNGEPFYCDMTYSSGKFYSEDKSEEFYVPQPIVKLDVEPKTEDTVLIEPWGTLPFEDKSINSIVIDLPFVIAPRTAPSLKKIDSDGNVIIKRFSSYYPLDELFRSVNHWLNEAYRVLEKDGICVFKTQSQVSGGKQIMSSEYSWYIATKIGFYTIDEFILIAKNRLHSGKIKKQQHARKFHSKFYVFKKCDKNINYLNFE